MTTHQLENGAHAAGEPGYETRDANIRAVLLAIAGLVVLCLVVQVGLWVLCGWLTNGNRPSDLRLTRPAGAEVLLENLRAHEDELLGSNGWEDKSAGRVRLKIGRAIELIAERGIPAQPSTKSELDVNSHGGKPADQPAIKAPGEGARK